MLVCVGHFKHTGEFGGEMALGSGSGSGGSVLGEFSSFCFLSSNNNSRRSSWVQTSTIEKC